MRRIQDGRPVLSCDVSSESKLLAHSLHIDISLSLQMLLRNVELQVSWCSWISNDSKKNKFCFHKQP